MLSPKLSSIFVFFFIADSNLNPVRLRPFSALRKKCPDFGVLKSATLGAFVRDLLIIDHQGCARLGIVRSEKILGMANSMLEIHLRVHENEKVDQACLDCTLVPALALARSFL